jgi:hypothetical protein
MQEQMLLHVLTCLLMFGVQESAQPVSVDVSLNQVRSVWLDRTITGTGLKKWRPVAVHKYVQDDQRDIPTDNSRGARLPRLRRGRLSRRNRSSGDLGDANRRSVGRQYGIRSYFCG